MNAKIIAITNQKGGVGKTTTCAKLGVGLTMEVSLVNAMSRETILKQYLDTVKKQYDFILLDCMPSLGMLTINALAASNSVIIPVQAQYLPAKGLPKFNQGGVET